MGGLYVLITVVVLYLLTFLDALIFSGTAFAAWCGVLISSGNAGQGRHIWDVSIAGIQRFALVRETQLFTQSALKLICYSLRIY